jgi:hypothetical protein
MYQSARSPVESHLLFNTIHPINRVAGINKVTITINKIA